MAGEALRLGVDLGGTKIEAVVLRAAELAEPRPLADLARPHAPEILARHRRPTPGAEGDPTPAGERYAAIVEATALAIAEVTTQAGLSAPPPIGVGMPGSVTTHGSAVPLVKNSNTTALNGRPFRRDLVARVARPIAFANDANCFALAEATWGAARLPGGAEVVFGVIIGTGVGGGVVFRGQAWDGRMGIAGEWGHVSLDPVSGPACYCGRRGCVERLISGPALERAYAARSGVLRSLPEIAARRTSDAAAAAVLSGLVEDFGRALATVIDVLDPSVVVLGGGVSNLDLLYDEGRAAVARWVFSDHLGTPIVRHALGDSAGVLGAALLPVAATTSGPGFIALAP